MAIGARGNTTYGPPLVTQKYKPLLMVVSATDSAIYNGLLANRSKLLSNLGLLPQPLNLAVPNWTTTAASEAGKNPPLVVISSNRSAWIKKGIESAASLKAERNRDFFNPSDLYAIYEVPLEGPELPETETPPRPARYAVSPPIYAPSRLGNAGARNVYIVVHMSEYDTYKKTLAGLGMTVVGWEFRLGASAPRKVALTGFGASRFAAMEFCKYLRSRAPAVRGNPPWDHAWIIDDNVIGVSQFPGFLAIESALTAAATAAGTDYACAGIKGGVQAHARLQSIFWAREQIRGGWGAQAETVPPVKTSGLLQQMVLWNVDYLTRQHINFSPAFITSAEDVSFGHYLSVIPVSYQYYSGMTVQKEETTYDNVAGSKKHMTLKNNLTALCTYTESANPPEGVVAPPPIIVDAGTSEGGVQLLADFIVKRVLPNSTMRDEAGKVGVQNNAKCQAVEQMISDAIAKGFILPKNLNAAFKLNGTVAQVVNPIQRP